MHKLLAQGAPDIVGTINKSKFPATVQGLSGVGPLLTRILQVVFVVAGIYAFFNLIIAGFQFMTAGGDAKAIEKAWARIWQSLMGLIIIVGSFALAALIGQIVFGKADFILNPVIYGP